MAGWTASVHCSNVLPEDHGALVACKQGNLLELRRQLDAGALSLYDTDIYGRPLAEILMLHNWNGYAHLANEPFDVIIENLRSFAEACSFPLTASLPEDCGYLRAPFYLVGGQAAGWTVQQRLTIFADAVSECRYPESYLPVLAAALTQPEYFETEYDVWWTPSLLHLLAEAVGRINYRDQVTAGPELRALLMRGLALGRLHHPSKFGVGFTPLLHLVFAAMDPPAITHYRSRLSAYLHSALMQWLAILLEANVDLERYGRKEAKIFRDNTHSSQERFWTYRPRHIRVVGFSYGAAPSDWRFWLEHPGDSYAGIFWDMMDHPERALPGGWAFDDAVEPETWAWRAAFGAPCRGNSPYWSA
ncbi:hypothetical protein LTR53_006591 [Teratosphaeriaceae sp. CCFEE 6253]|nr:hypothetical protein LTR53_006591 [Teratosphaeriaceae sp. CCFEE 6253]